MEFIYNYITNNITNNIKSSNLLNKINILDLGDNKNDIVDIFRNKMYICSYDLLDFNNEYINRSLDENKPKINYFRYNNIINFESLSLSTKKYNHIIIHNNLKDLFNLIFENFKNKNENKKENVILDDILGSFLFLMKKNGYIFLIIDDRYKKKYNIIMDNYLDKKLKMISCIALNKQEFFKYYLFIIRKVN